MRALITGLSSGIGKSIGEKLSSNGYEILSLKSRFEDLSTLEKELKDLKNTQIDVLINCAGFGLFGQLEDMRASQIAKLINVNLTAALIITSSLLKNLKSSHGHIINIASIEATRHSKFSCVYTASKAGLRAFSLSLFEEVRKTGVKVTNINPDITKTAFFDDLHFMPSNAKDTYINPEQIADMVLKILRFEANISEITIQAQRFEIKKK